MVSIKEKCLAIKPYHILILIVPLLCMASCLAIGPILMLNAIHYADNFLDNKLELNCTVLDYSIIHGNKLEHHQINNDKFISSREDSYATVKFQYQLYRDDKYENHTDIDFLFKGLDERSGVFELRVEETYPKGSVHPCYLDLEDFQAFMFVPQYHTLEQYNEGYGYTIGISSSIGALLCLFLCFYKDCIWDDLGN